MIYLRLADASLFCYTLVIVTITEAIQMLITGEHKLAIGRLDLSSINTGARKRLARKIVDVDNVYLLNLNREKGILLVLAVEGDTWKLIEDTAADPQKGFSEIYRESSIDREGIEIIVRAAQSQLARSPGRPAQYKDAQEGQEIFVAHIYEGKPIRQIAKEMHMSPSTVQKILNRVRLHVADDLVNGVLPLDPESGTYAQSLEVLRWAVKNSTGEKQDKYRTFLHSVLM